MNNDIKAKASSNEAGRQWWCYITVGKENTAIEEVCKVQVLLRLVQTTQGGHKMPIHKAKAVNPICCVHDIENGVPLI